MNIALILSGGIGHRLGADIPKQYIEICGKPIITYSFEKFSECKCIDAIIIVAAIEWRDYILQHVGGKKLMFFSDPGETRQISIINGLRIIKNIASDDDDVIIHDAARPLVSVDLIEKCIFSAEGHDGSLPVLPMKDTVYFCENGNAVTSLLEREKLFAGQAPEAFKFKKYVDANERLLPDRIFTINGATEPAILAGMDISVFMGDENNFKITTKNDLIRFEEIVRAR